MKIAFGIIIFNTDFILQEVLESIYQFADQILIAEGPVKYWQEQGYTTSVDQTNEILHSFPDPENKIKVHHGQYSEKDEQCNAYMKFLNSDIDYIWNLDADEVFKQNDINHLLSIIEKNNITSVGFKSLTFYGGFNHYLTGFEEGAEFQRISKIYPGAKWRTHRPPTIANPKWQDRHLDYNLLAEMGIRMYHYSYVFPRQVKEKIFYYKNALSKENCIDNYFEEVYLKWVLGDIETRKQVEQKYQGVHEFIPSYRGDCYTQPFMSEHPPIIQQNMEKLIGKYRDQLYKFLD